jgi:hypothetical protein
MITIVVREIDNIIIIYLGELEGVWLDGVDNWLDNVNDVD